MIIWSSLAPDTLGFQHNLLHGAITTVPCGLLQDSRSVCLKNCRYWTDHNISLRPIWKCYNPQYLLDSTRDSDNVSTTNRFIDSLLLLLIDDCGAHEESSSFPMVSLSASWMTSFTTPCIPIPWRYLWGRIPMSDAYDVHVVHVRVVLEGRMELHLLGNNPGTETQESTRHPRKPRNYLPELCTERFTARWCTQTCVARWWLVVSCVVDHYRGQNSHRIDHTQHHTPKLLFTELRN